MYKISDELIYLNYILIIKKGDYKPNDIELPLANTKHHSFTVLDTTEGFVQIAVNHLGEESRFTNIYLSDYRGLQFTLSLLYAVRDSEGNIDCEKILGSGKKVFM